MDIKSQSYAYSIAYQHFKDENKARIASEAYMVGINYNPIGWNIRDSIDDLEDLYTSHISTNYKPKPYGFFVLPFGGIIFNFLIKEIISWAVRKIIENLWSKNAQTLNK